MSPSCVCIDPKEPTSRSLRSGTVLHYNGENCPVLVLSEATSPNRWKAALYTDRDPAWQSSIFVSDMGSRSKWHIASGGVLFPVPSVMSSDVALGLTTKAIEAANGVAASSFPRGTSIKSAEAAKIVAKIAAKTPLPGYAFDETTTLVPKDLSAATARGKKATVSSKSFSPPAPNPDRYFYESEDDARLLSDYVSMRLAGHVTNLMVVGASGFGKTDSAVRLGERLSVPVHVVNCQAITTPEKWIGQMQVDPERGTYFEVANHVKWVERTHPDCADAPYCILLYDEITRLRPELANMTFSLLDFQQGLEVPQMGKRIMMDPMNIVIATANMGSAYSGAFTMDWALRERFDTTLERKMPPAPEEMKVIRTAVRDRITEDDAQSMIRVADHTRTLWKRGDLESPISTRMLISWSRFVAGGYSVREAAEYTVIPMFSEDGQEESDRAKVRLALGGKVAS